MPDRKPNPDDFWDVEALLPKELSRRPRPQPRPTPAAVEVELPSAPPAETTPVPRDNPVADQPLTPGEHRSVQPSESAPSTTPRREEAPSPHTPLLEYTPEGALLHRVRVFGWQANFHYFDQFADDAVRYHAMKPPTVAKPETFFSYFPQYVQLGRRTTAWYLYWREGVRRGIYMDTDYAYILLYLFELINLPADDAETARGYRDLMANVWMAYRKSYPQLDHYMCEWLCDYCLIHALPAPIDLLASALDDIIMGSRLKEFYFSAAVRVPEDGSMNTALETARILMRHCCQYDYHKSKFASGEHKELFDSTIPAAVAAVIPLLLGEGGRKPAITMLDSTLTRDAYTGALCSYRNKRRIEVAYTSFSRSHELRFLVGDMVKHVENRLRSWIGVRSKLSVMSLPIPLRDALDAYLAPLEPPKSMIPTKKKDTPRPDYEALYDLPRKEVSLADAAAIEADSWETTRILVEAFGDSVDPTPVAVPDAAPASPPAAPSPAESFPVLAVLDAGKDQSAPTPPSQSVDPEEGFKAALSSYRPFLRAVLSADRAAQKQAASALHKMPDAVADEINTLTADPEAEENPICDIILEEDGLGGYTLIEDYRDLLLPLL